MSKVCQITGKKPKMGMSRSHSNIASKRMFKVNIQKKKLFNPATGKFITLSLSSRALKTLKKWDESGKQYNLEKFIKQ